MHGFYAKYGVAGILRIALWPSGSPFAGPGPHGDLFQFLGPHFFQGPHFLFLGFKNALKVSAATIY